MAKIYLLRHQAHGYAVSYPFSSPPTEGQLGPVRALLAAVHGHKHPKSGEPFWDRVEEIEVLGPSDVPKVSLPGEEPAAGRGAGEFTDLKAEGRGSVRNPKR
jgi:hypothetical protein